MKDEINNKIQRTDHDTLIRLEAKVDQIGVEIKELKDGLNVKVADLDNRVKLMEKLRDELSPIESHQRINELWQWKHDFSLTWKVIITIASVVGGVVGFILSVVTNIMGIFK